MGQSPASVKLHSGSMELELGPHHFDVSSFDFSSFLQVFFLGDPTPLLANSPRGVPGVEPALKNTMMLAVARRLPVLAAIPVTTTVVLFVATVLNMLLRLLAPLHEGTQHVIFDHNSGFKRMKRSSADSQPGFSMLLGYLDGALEHFLSSTNEEEEEGRMGSHHQGVAKMGAVAEVMKDWVDVVVAVMPGIGSCFGTLVGCHVRFHFLGQLCFPSGVVKNCATLLGATIRKVLNTVKKKTS